MNKKIAIILAASSFFISGYNHSSVNELLDIAKSYSATGDNDKAGYYFNRAIATDSGSIEAYQARAFFYLKLSERELAVEDFSSIIKIAPKNSGAYVSRGLVFANDSEHKKRVAADFKAACELDNADGCKFLKELGE